ncbi:MAG: hypothetical protein AAFX41_17710, partial [Bacteroidota bacterium]
MIPRVTLFSYDRRGRVVHKWVLTKGVGPTVEKFTYEYDNLDRVTARGVEVGAHTLWHFYDYDARGLLSNVYVNTDNQQPLYPVVAYTYNADGSVAEVKQHGTDQGFAHVLRHTYDVRGRLETIGAMAAESWVEQFDEASPSSLTDTGETAWSVDASAVAPKSSIGAWDGHYLAADLNGELVWTSEPIDISAAASVDLSVLAKRAHTSNDGVTGLSEERDYLRISYLIDGGAEVTVAELAGYFTQQTVAAPGLSGNTLTVVIRARGDTPSEYYQWDDVVVTDASGATLWAEAFTGLPSGALSDTGATAWDTDTADVSPSPNYQVTDGQFEVRGTGGELVWTSEVIDTADMASFQVSVDVAAKENSGLDASGPYADYLRVYYRLDGGSEVLIEGFDGDIPGGEQTVVSGSLTGSTAQVVVRALASGFSEFYYWDEVRVGDQQVFSQQLTYRPDDTIEAVAFSNGVATQGCNALELGDTTCAADVQYR